MANTTTKKTVAARRAKFAKRMHIMKAWNGSYHVLEVPGSNSEPIKAWPGPFHSKRAAELMLEDLIEPHVEGNLDDFEHVDLVAKYEREAAFVELIEKHGGVNDPRGLACLLAEKQPWFCRGGPATQDDDIPF